MTTPTPRTDAIEKAWSEYDVEGGENHPPTYRTFARQLEQELNSVRNECVNLNYQVASNQYDVLKAEVAKSKRLEQELNAVRKYELAYHTFVKAYGSSPSDFASSALIERDTLKRERDEAIKQIQVPGAWTCDKCGFNLVKSILHANTGSISANNEPFVERCPNDGTLMRPATYKEYAKSNYDGALKAYEERDTLRKEQMEMNELRKAQVVELAQLRKVVDDYALAWELYQVFPSLSNERLFKNADDAYNQLPHVLERKTK